ncbi:uncharacterized protein LOC126474460 [Schistocerca serialis cubense]|uniref:uncharacterized protein LOC126474460 n=1 Tax=Schistocerca serialis cubense TaxID=2023355 RepID=UPI00214ED7AB|nr:uncharacterized protein LOC126474460 [Schistocerca serialis cubense]
MNYNEEPKKQDHHLSSVIILTPSPLTPEGSIGQTLPAESEDRSGSILSYSWSKMMGKQPRKEQTSPEESHAQEQTESISAQLPTWGSEQDALQEKSVLPGPDEQSDMEAPVAKLSHQTVAEESDLRQQLLKMDEPLVTERTPRPILKEGGVQTSKETVELKEGGVQTSKETVELLSQENKAKALQKDAGMQTQRKKRDVKPPLKESAIQTKQLQETIDKELLHERGAHGSPPRKRPQRVQEKREIRRPLKKIEEEKTLKDHKPKFQPKKEGVQGAPKKGANLLPLQQRQGRSSLESSHTQAPLKQTQDQQIPKSDFQEPLEDTKTQPVTSRVRTETTRGPNLILVPMQKNEHQTVPEQEETEVFVENYDTQSVPDDGEGHTLPKVKSIQESQQIPEQTHAVKDVESVRVESDSMLAESKSSCTQASMLWLRGLQRLTQQLQAAPKLSEASIAAPQVDAVGEQLKPVQEDIRPKVSFVADVSVSSGSLLSCTVNTMLTASSSSIISEFKRWKHFDSYGGDKDSAKFASTAAESMDDTRPVVGGASGDSQLIQQEKEFGETSSLASEFHFEEENAIQGETEVTSEKGEDETSHPEQVPQQKKTRPSVRKCRPKAPPNRRRPGSPLMRGVGETLPTDAATGTLLKQERTPIQRKNIGTQTLKRKHVSRVLTKKRAMHKMIEERLDEEPEEQSEVTEEKTKNLDEESSTEAEQDLVVTPAVESNRKSSGIATPAKRSSWTHTYASWLQNQQQLYLTRLEDDVPEQQSPTVEEEGLLSTVRLSSPSHHSVSTVPSHTGQQTEQLEASRSPSRTSTLQDWQPSLEDLDDELLTDDGAPPIDRLPSIVPSYTSMQSGSYGGGTLEAKRSSWTETYMSWLENQELLAQQLQELRLRNESLEQCRPKLQDSKQEEERRVVVYTAPAVTEAARATVTQAETADVNWLTQAGRMLSALPLPKGPGP